MEASKGSISLGDRESHVALTNLVTITRGCVTLTRRLPELQAGSWEGRRATADLDRADPTGEMATDAGRIERRLSVIRIERDITDAAALIEDALIELAEVQERENHQPTLAAA